MAKDDLRHQLDAEFPDKAYRDAYRDSYVSSSIASQVRWNRIKQKLSQRALAELAEMNQPKISALENATSEGPSVRTLKRIAKALDLGLIVKFVTYSELIDEVESFGKESLVKEPGYVAGQANLEYEHHSNKVGANEALAGDYRPHSGTFVTAPLFAGGYRTYGVTVLAGKD